MWRVPFQVVLSIFLGGIDVIAETSPPAVPGTGIATPGYDPNHGGWDSAQAAEIASSRLDALKETLASGKPAAGLAEIAAPSFRGAPLRPTKRTQPYTDDVVQVHRAGRDASDKFRCPGGWTQAVLSLTKGLNTGPLQVKFKTVGVESSRTQVEIHLEIRLNGKSTSGQILQVNSAWSCTWKRTDNALTLERFIVEDYEEVITTSTRGALFTDATATVIGRDPAFQNQLAHGLDHWLARLDTRVGLKVGGWKKAYSSMKTMARDVPPRCSPLLSPTP